MNKQKRHRNRMEAPGMNSCFVRRDSLGLVLISFLLIPHFNPGEGALLRAAETVPFRGPGAVSKGEGSGTALGLDGPASDLGGGKARLGSVVGAPKSPGSARKTSTNKSIEGEREVRRATEIVSQGGVTYDPTEGRAIFSGAVQITHPVFDLSCETLTAYLNRSKVGQAVEPAAAATGESEGAVSGKGFSAPSALDRAVAEGRVVITQEKRNEKGEMERSVGRAQKVVYDSVTGNVTLSGWPRVEQKQNLIVALEESTVMVMNKSGKVDVRGQSKTVLQDSKIEE